MIVKTLALPCCAEIHSPRGESNERRHGFVLPFFFLLFYRLRPRPVPHRGQLCQRHRTTHGRCGRRGRRLRGGSLHPPRPADLASLRVPALLLLRLPERPVLAGPSRRGDASPCLPWCGTALDCPCRLTGGGIGAFRIFLLRAPEQGCDFHRQICAICKGYTILPRDVSSVFQDTRGISRVSFTAGVLFCFVLHV